MQRTRVGGINYYVVDGYLLLRVREQRSSSCISILNDPMFSEQVLPGPWINSDMHVVASSDNNVKVAPCSAGWMAGWLADFA